jgi:hypothetical protein
MVFTEPCLGNLIMNEIIWFQNTEAHYALHNKSETLDYDFVALLGQLFTDLGVTFVDEGARKCNYSWSFGCSSPHSSPTTPSVAYTHHTQLFPFHRIPVPAPIAPTFPMDFQSCQKTTWVIWTSWTETRYLRTRHHFTSKRCTTLVQPWFPTGLFLTVMNLVYCVTLTRNARVARVLLLILYAPIPHSAARTNTTVVRANTAPKPCLHVYLIERTLNAYRYCLLIIDIISCARAVELYVFASELMWSYVLFR